jgi:hypothetical protein
VIVAGLLDPAWLVKIEADPSYPGDFWLLGDFCAP